jgi:hypothetical protein
MPIKSRWRGLLVRFTLCLCLGGEMYMHIHLCSPAAEWNVRRSKWTKCIRINVLDKNYRDNTHRDKMYRDKRYWDQMYQPKTYWRQNVPGTKHTDDKRSETKCIGDKTFLDKSIARQNVLITVCIG